MNWRHIMREKTSTQYPQNPHNTPLAGGSGGIEDIKHRVLIPVAPLVLPSDIADHFHERAGALEFDGECPRDLADHVALLETLRWWLQLQHPEVLAQWMLLAFSVREQWGV
jgi:hypothetical protein